MLGWLALYGVMLVGLVRWRDPHAAQFGRAATKVSEFTFLLGVVLMFAAPRYAAARRLRIAGGLCLLVPLAFILAAFTAVLVQL